MALKKRLEAYRPASYHPSVLLKLYIYGYFNRVQSSRRLERETGRNVEVTRVTRNRFNVVVLEVSD